MCFQAFLKQISYRDVALTLSEEDQMPNVKAFECINNGVPALEGG